MGIVVSGGLVKAFFWGFYALTNDVARIGRLRFYRWWARGWVPVALALLPGVVVRIIGLLLP